MLRELFFAYQLAAAPVQQAEHGSFAIDSSNPDPVITCAVDEPCTYETDVMAINRVEQPLYGSTWYTDRLSGAEFLGFNGQWTNGQSETIQPILPGEGISTRFRFSPPNEPGTYSATLYVDGRVCNIRFPVPDCVAYGGSHRTFTVNRV